MHPGDADALIDGARREAVYHLQLEVTRVRTPSAADHEAGHTAAVVEGVVRVVFRTPSEGGVLAPGEPVRLTVDPCIPVGHPELLPVTPSIAGEVLEKARFLEAYVGPDMAVEHACVAALDAPTSAPTL